MLLRMLQTRDDAGCVSQLEDSLDLPILIISSEAIWDPKTSTCVRRQVVICTRRYVRGTLEPPPSPPSPDGTYATRG